MVPWRVNLGFTPQQDPLRCSTWDQQLLSSDLRRLCLKSMENPLPRAVSVLDYLGFYKCFYCPFETEQFTSVPQGNCLTFFYFSLHKFFP